MRVTIAVSAILSFATFGCSSLSNHPHVYIDDSFSSEMSQGILDGQTSWESHVSALHFTPVFISHENAMSYSANPPDDTIVFVRVSGYGKDNHECRNDDNVKSFFTPASHKSLAVTNVSTFHSGVVICVWQDIVNSYNRADAFVAPMIHEIGHAYKLQHDGEKNTAVMYGLFPGMADNLTCRDLVQFRSLHSDWLADYTCAEESK